MAARLGDPSIAAGDLDKRVTLLSPVYNEAGDEIVDWTAATDVWAGIDTVVAMEPNEAGRQIAVTMLQIVIRYRTDIDARWRIQDHEHLYEIKGMQDIARRRVHLELTCEEIL
jgi:SPP1 family predicted phage head-tail adaptor